MRATRGQTPSDLGSAERRWPLTSLVALAAFVFVPFLWTVTEIALDPSTPAEEPNGTAMPDTLDFSTGAEDPADRADPATSDRPSVQDWFESRVPGRELAAEFQRSTTRVIDDRYTQAVEDQPRVELGEDGYLFLTDATDIECVGPAEETQWRLEIDRTNRLVEASGRSFLLAVAPDRAIVIPEKLGGVANDCEQANHSVVQRLAKADGVVLDLSVVVNQEIHVSQLDTHWSPLGALEGSKLIVNTIQPGLWDSPRISTEDVSRQGDLDKLAGYDNTEVVREPTIEIDSPLVLERAETSLPGRPLVTARSGAPVDLSLLVVHDSFGGYIDESDPSRYRAGLAIDYLRPWFTTVSNVRMASDGIGIVGEEPVAGAARDADVITVLVVQRKLSIRLEPGRLVLPLAAALADDLDAQPFGGIAETDGVVIIDGISGPTAGVPLAGPITARANYPGRIVVLVETGAQLEGPPAGSTWRFIPLS